ncbi:hypothetical protein HY086_03355 [Candidatus Gottesmanbacteria bacterium]|nr:hypothetical protein [Candidatus Gottesmanbacteria bacterium]
MPQVSKNPIQKDVFYQIRDDFLWVFSALRSTEEVKSFFYDFFTKTEQVMFAKRFAVALMLDKGFDYRDIRQILHVSTGTIAYMTNWLEQGGIGLKTAIRKLNREERMEEFWRKVNKLIERTIVNPGKYKYG